MASYRIDKLAELGRQMAFTPQDTRLAQVNAAEELLHCLDVNKAYPLEFVVFRITGYHPRNRSDELLAGLALQHDLGLLIEQVSNTLNAPTSAAREPVLSVDDVAERFNVTSKTIQRWRRRGLPARRFLFPDGKRRVGFLLHSVERFIDVHREQVDRGTNFSQLDDPERRLILDRAARLSVQCRCCEREICRRIARKLNRSPLTILHTIRRHDQEHPEQAIFVQSAQPLPEVERQRIVRGYRRGLPLSALARRVCRTRASVYRVVLDERIDRLRSRKARFIDDPLYHQPDAAEVLEQIASQDELSPISRPEDSRLPRDLPPHLLELCRTPLLSPSRERALFLKFNFHKFQFVIARRALEPQSARVRDVEELEKYLQAAIETKNAIVRANLRLVLSVARKHLRPYLSLMELISDGNLALMRAVESFDVHRGYRFSTYATLALMKGFARCIPKMLNQGRATLLDGRALGTVPDRRETSAADRIADRDHVRLLLSQLNERERSVLSSHYGLGSNRASTLEQLGRRMGLSKHRVRQIEQSALTKLRNAAGSQLGG